MIKIDNPKLTVGELMSLLENVPPTTPLHLISHITTFDNETVMMNNEQCETLRLEENKDGLFMFIKGYDVVRTNEEEG